MPELAKVSFHHDAVIDEILLDPTISQRELSKRFGFTEAWMSIIINSDAFKNRLEERKGELIDPKIRATITDRLDAVARRSLDKILDRLDNPAANIKNLELVAMAKLGVGDKNNRPAQSSGMNLYVVQMPNPAVDAESWLAGKSTPRSLPMVEEVNRD